MMNAETLKKLLADTLPTADILSVEDSIWDSYIQHGLFLWKNSPYCKELPQERFLQFVFYPRVNNEKIVDCRPFFFSLLHERVQGMCAKDAVLEVNRWCAEHVTYKSSDDRTEDPITAYRTGIGRCGEESTFLVSALRSIGIPARQIYVPFWSHCDDNHAWVEAWTGDGWHFLGACEPEPILDRGWFLDASSRAPIACYRTFYPCNEADPSVDRIGSAHLYSVISRYAETNELTIHAPVGADIQISVVNMAAFQRVAGTVLDGSECFSIKLGKGSYLVEVSLDGNYDSRITDLTAGASEITLKPKALSENAQVVRLPAPAVTNKNQSLLSAEQTEAARITLAACTEKRIKNAEMFQNSEHASDQWIPFLNTASANQKEISAFLQNRQPDELPIAYALLRTLSEKDLRDISQEMLEHHWNASIDFSGTDDFVPYILNPRIGWENISHWRSLRSIPFTTPEALWQSLHIHSAEGSRVYPGCVLPPELAWQAHHCDEISKRTCFVAILRSHGIPARLSQIDGIPEYRQSGLWKRICLPMECFVQFSFPDEALQYGLHYTISRWDGCSYSVLSRLQGGKNEVPSGFYRLTVTNRLPNGNQLCFIRTFALKKGQGIQLPISLPPASPEEMLGNSILPPFTVRTLSGGLLSSKEILTDKSLLIYLQPQQEPSAHILNELVAAEGKTDSLHLLFLLSEETAIGHPLLQKVLRGSLHARAFLANETQETHARKLFAEPGVYPLMILTDESHRAYYGSSGYNVGSVELAIRLADTI